MKVFVTGATGFIGSNLVKRLLEEGYTVRVLVRKKDARFPPSVERKVGDLTDLDSLREAVKGVGIVFNLAAGLPYHRLSREKYWQVNVTGVENIIQACIEAKVKRLIHISTVGIYGPSNGKIINENSPIHITDAYSETKTQGEKLIKAHVKDLPFVIIKPTIGYGPGDTRPGFVNLFRLINKGMFIRVGSGENFFHTVYIDNLIDALILASKKKGVEGKDFIIGDNPCPTMNQIVNAISKIERVSLLPFKIPWWFGFISGKFCDVLERLKLPSPLTSQRFKFITQNRRYDISKAERLLRFKPKVSLEEGVEKTYKWYQLNGYLK